MARRFFFDLATSLSNAASGLGNDFQQGLDAARERGVLVNIAASDFSAAIAEQTTDRKALTQRTLCEVSATVAVLQVCDANQTTVESQPGITPSTGGDLGDVASDGARCFIPPDPDGAEVPEHIKKGQILLKDPSPADVLIRSAAQLAKIDFQMAGVYLEEFNDGDVSEEIQKQTVYGAEKIRRMIAASSSTQPRSNQEGMAEAREIVKISEDLTGRILQTEIGASSEPEPTINDVDKSGLHAGKLLTPSIRRHLQALLTALVQQLSCCDEKHFIRLKLTGFVDQIDRESRSIFNMYLSTGHDCARSYWVESTCTFMKELTHGGKKGCGSIKNSVLQKKKLSLLLRDTRIQDSGTRNTSEVEDAQESLYPIQLDISGGSNSSATPIVSIASLIKQRGPGYELRRIFNDEEFSNTEKDWLCLNLALSMLHLSSGDWRRVIWYSDNPNASTGIFFLRDPSTQKVVDKTRPYISWRLQEKSSVQTPIKGLHCDPQLLDFARLLIEIHKWKRLQLAPNTESEGVRRELHRKPYKEQLRLRLLQYIGDKDNFRPEWDSQFTSALENCLVDAGRIEAAAEEKPERIQAYVLEKIVKPLHRYLGSPELSKDTLIAGPSPDLAALKSLNQPEESLPIYDSSVDYDEPEDKSPHEKRFWDRMTKFTGKHISTLQNYTLSDQPEPCPREKVRIAVIDSGVREEDVEIAAAVATGQIRGCRNFTSLDPNDCEDHIKHGTMVARLLLTVAPEAELYIAKVSNQKKMPKSQLHRIAEAIKWAIQEWDVDIISISLALSEGHYDIDEELTEALKGKIVFAAAGNQGVYEPRAWPASKKGVIAIHATDWSGAGTRANPSREDDLNFATLGYNIKMPWPDPTSPDKRKDVYISGSSFATPIAAGIGANVLEFARHRLNLDGWMKSRFYSHDGMTKILKAMSGPRGDYDFVHPLLLWEEAYRGGVWREQRQLFLPPRESTNICKVLNFIVR